MNHPEVLEGYATTRNGSRNTDALGYAAVNLFGGNYLKVWRGDLPSAGVGSIPKGDSGDDVLNGGDILYKTLWGGNSVEGLIRMAAMLKRACIINAIDNQYDQTKNNGNRAVRGMLLQAGLDVPKDFMSGSVEVNGIKRKITGLKDPMIAVEFRPEEMTLSELTKFIDYAQWAIQRLLMTENVRQQRLGQHSSLASARPQMASAVARRSLLGLS